MKLLVTLALLAFAFKGTISLVGSSMENIKADIDQRHDRIVAAR